MQNIDHDLRKKYRVADDPRKHEKAPEKEGYVRSRVLLEKYAHL